MDKQPLVSVIMPVYNGERFVSEAIDSVRNQTYSDFELIIVDDGSQDKSAEIVTTHQAADDRIVFLQQSSAGVSAARNAAIQKARGQWIFFIDCDDVYYPTYLERMLQVSQETGADYVCCSYDTGYRLSTSFPDTPTPNKNAVVFEGDTEAAFRYLVTQGVATGPCFKQFSREALRRYTIVFDTRMTYGEDFFFCWKACLASKVVAYIPESLYFYRQTASSAVSRVHQNVFEKYDAAYADMKEFAVQNGWMNDSLAMAFDVSFAQRLPAVLRMTIREKRPLRQAIRRIRQMVEAPPIHKALTNAFEQVCAGSSGVTYQQYRYARNGNILRLYCSAWYCETRFQLARKIKGDR